MPKRNQIFTMTCVSGDPFVEGTNRLRSVCWGYYFDQQKAEKAIECNATDMSERGYYRYAVLTSMPEGPCAIGKVIQWYQFIWSWDVEAGSVEDNETFVEARKIDMPEKYSQICFGGL